KRGSVIGGSTAPIVSIAGVAKSGTPTESVAAIREKNAAAAQERTSEAADYFAKARQAEADGKPGIAQIYYQMVIRRDHAQLKQLAQGRLVALRGGKLSTVTQR